VGPSDRGDAGAAPHRPASTEVFPLGSHQRAARAPISKLNPFGRGYDVAKREVGFWKSKCAEVRVVGFARPRQLTGTGLAHIWKRSSVSRRTGKRAGY